MLSDTLFSGARDITRALTEGSVDIPPPPQSVAGWPLIGKSLAEFWELASTNLEEALSEIGPHLKAAAKWLLERIAGAGISVLQFAVAIIIAGVLLAHGEGGGRTAQAIAARLAEQRGAAFLELMRATIRSVARGILGVALIQSLLAGLGFLVIGVPAAGLWALLCLLLAVGAYSLLGYYYTRDALVEHLHVLARVIGNNSAAAITFDDPATRAEIVAAIEAQVVPRLFEGRPAGAAIRVWCPGCARLSSPI